jgi:hypothetical protein
VHEDRRATRSPTIEGNTTAKDASTAAPITPGGPPIMIGGQGERRRRG